MTYLSKSRGTGTDVSEVELLVCLEDKWSQFLYKIKFKKSQTAEKTPGSLQAKI